MSNERKSIRECDKRAFSEAASKERFNAWILLRATNPDSLDYIGMPGYCPKPIGCKAKTAKHNSHNGRYRTAGLVVDPTISPGAFAGCSANGRSDVDKSWESFEQDCNTNRKWTGAYSVDTDRNSQRYGCVTYLGDYIHGDYDLKGVILIDHPSANLVLLGMQNGVPVNCGPRIRPVQEFINGRIGVPMIQHPADDGFRDHSDDDSVWAFGPAGEVELLSPQQVKEKYLEWNRKTLVWNDKMKKKDIRFTKS